MASLGPILIALIALGNSAACWGGCFPTDVDLDFGEAQLLVSEGRLIGLTRDELITELGRGSDKKTFEGWDFVYYLGSDEACVDSRWLVVRLDDSNHVALAKVTND